MKYAAIAVVVLACALTAKAVPVQWTVGEGGNGNWYELVESSSIHWNTAKTSAEGLGGYLATITSQAENDFIADLLPDALGNNYWLGGYQDTLAPDYSEPAGGWRWITGEIWDYTNWNGGEPNNSSGRPENYLHIYAVNFPPYWNDAELTEPRAGFIMESVPEPATMGLLALGGLAMLKRRK